VATATRLAAARREQRLAALRLAGATTGQVGVVAAVEAAIAALTGTTAGFGLFFAIRPRLARIPLDGAAFYPSDLDLSPGWAAAIALAVPALAMTAAVISLRRIRISPLGVARRAVPPKPTPRPLLLVATGMAGLALAVVWDRSTRHGEIALAYAIGAAFLVMIVGIVLSGPWLTSVVGRGIARVGRRAPSLLAARRLQENPAAGFRAISGIIVAVFVGTVFSGIAASILANNDPQDAGLAADVVAAVPREDPLPLMPGVDPQKAPPPPTEVRPDVVAELEDDLAAVPGVDQVVTAHAVPDDRELRDALARTSAGFDPTTMLISCADAATLGFDRCEGTTTVNASGYRVTSDGVPTPLSVAEVEALPVTAMAAATDGSTEAVEQTRTILERGLPGAGGVTKADLEAESQEELRTEERVSNIALAVTLVIAGCSLAVAVAGAIVERRRSFAQLRLAGTRLSDLRRVVMAEAAAPLLMVAGASVALGLAVARLVLAASGGGQPFVVPGAGYWVALAGGLALALLVVLGTLPLLSRLTALDSARFE
jgi:predicted lysophospholipase L1 biosynthesis ABC-type transport system permease subunit